MPITLTYFKVDEITEFVDLTFPAAPFAALVINPDTQSPDAQFKLAMHWLRPDVQILGLGGHFPHNGTTRVITPPC